MAGQPTAQSARQTNTTTHQQHQAAALVQQGPVALGMEIGLLQIQLAQADPLAASPRTILQLQRRYGNRAVGQALRVVQKNGNGKGGSSSASLEQQLAAQRGRGQPLPAEIRSFMEPRFGTDFSDVRVHADGEAAQLSRDLSAQAFTHGRDVYFGAGRYAPGTDSGKRLLAHELTHVVQQKDAWSDRAWQPAIQRQKDETEGEKKKEEEGTESTRKEPENPKSTPAIEASPTTGTAQSVFQASPTPKPVRSVQTGQESATQETAVKGLPVTTEPSIPPRSPAPKQKPPAPQWPPVSLFTQWFSGIETLAPEVRAALFQFREAVAPRRENLIRSAEQKKQLFLVAAQTERRNLQTALQNEINRIEENYAQTVQQVQLATEQSRLDIASQRDTQVKAISQAAETELVNLEKVVPQQQASVRQIGQAKAAEAKAAGEREALRAMTETARREARARTIGEQKVGQYQKYDQASRIAGVARSMASETAQRIARIGRKTAQVARQDAAKLAAKFRREAEQLAARFDQDLGNLRQNIRKKRDDTISTLNRLAQEATEKVEAAERETLAQLQQARQGANQGIQGLLEAAQNRLDREAQTAVHTIDTHTVRAVTRLDEFVGRVVMTIKGMPGPQARQETQAALADLDEALGMYHAGLTRYANDMQRIVIGGIVKQATQQVAERVTQLVGSMQQAGATFEKKTTIATGQVAEEMGNLVDQSAGAMRAAVQQVVQGFQQVVAKSESTWNGELQRGITDIRNKVNRSVAIQDTALTELRSKIDEKANELENAGWFRRLFMATLKFIGGVIVGFFKGLWDNLLGVLYIALIALTVASIVVLVLAWLVGSLAGAVLLLTTLAFAYGAIIAKILAVLAVVGIIAGVVAAAVYVYRALTEDQGAYQSGEWVGRAAAEIFLAFFLKKILGKIKKWGRKIRSKGKGAERLEEVIEKRTTPETKERAQKQIGAYLERRGDPNRWSPEQREYIERMDRAKAELPFKTIRRNFGTVDCDIHGPNGKNVMGRFDAVSGTKSPANTVRMPAHRHYKTFTIGHPRDYDSEVKLLEYLTHQLVGEESGVFTNFRGEIMLFTERPPCASCLGVMAQFRAKFPNIALKVLSSQGIHGIPH